MWEPVTVLVTRFVTKEREMVKQLLIQWKKLPRNMDLIYVVSFHLSDLRTSLLLKVVVLIEM